ncbi:MAG: Gfo/Idh/MocA family protein [bacterium]|jgi:predicted dehydrogenase
MKYRVGSIGLEGHTRYAFEPMQELDNVELVAVSNVSSAEVARLKKNYQIQNEIRQYENYQEMLDREELDIVCIYTDHGIRAQSIIDSASTGASVFTEKPLTRTLAELEQVRQAIEKHSTCLTMMLDLRFNGIYRKMKEVVDAGIIGEVALATAQKSYKLENRPEWMRNESTYAGIIPFIGCHALDLIRWVTGREFVKGSAFQSRIGHPELKDFDNSASMICLADNGATFSTRLDYCRPSIASTWGDDRLRVAGLEGVVEAQDGRVTLLVTGKKEHELEPLPNISQFKNMIAWMEGKEEVVIPPSDCVRITEICLKLHEAAKKEQVVEL